MLLSTTPALNYESYDIVIFLGGWGRVFGEAGGGWSVDRQCQRVRKQADPTGMILSIIIIFYEMRKDDNIHKSMSSKSV